MRVKAPLIVAFEQHSTSAVGHCGQVEEVQPRQVRKAEERVCNPRSCHHLGVCIEDGTIIIVAASTDHGRKFAEYIGGDS